MTFEQLYHFTEVYRQKSITKAADNLYVSRQALSLSIRKLENEFNVSLFTRLANGVEATKAGEKFYHSARRIISEAAILRQNMLKCTPSSTAKTICKVGIPDSLITAYGNKLLNTLSDAFEQIYFDCSRIVVAEMPQFYQEFDFSLAVVFDEHLKDYYALREKGYFVKYLTAYPVYIWLSATSPWNEYTSLDLGMLHNTPFCSLKNIYSGVSFINVIREHINQVLDNRPAIELTQNFIDYIEKFGYFTIDLPIDEHKLFYETLFADRNIVLKPTSHTFHLIMIYQNDSCHDFYPFIADIFCNE